MSFSHRPIVTSALKVSYPTVVGPVGGIAVNSAVAVIEQGGQFLYTVCGALPGANGDKFVGFLAAAVGAGEKGRVITGRGSQVNPLVEGGVPLVPNQDVFLSATPGQVTQTPIDGGANPGAQDLRVGYAISSGLMVLVTDAYVEFGG